MQGLVDLDAELAKCEKKLDLARLNMRKIEKVEAQPEYEETVPANVRLVNEEKVICVSSRTGTRWLIVIGQRKTLKAEIDSLELSKLMFAQLK